MSSSATPRRIAVADEAPDAGMNDEVVTRDDQDSDILLVILDFARS